MRRSKALSEVRICKSALNKMAVYLQYDKPDTYLRSMAFIHTHLCNGVTR